MDEDLSLSKIASALMASKDKIVWIGGVRRANNTLFAMVIWGSH